MSTVITDHGSVGDAAAASNSVSITLTSDVPHGTPTDPNWLVIPMAYEGTLDTTNAYNNTPNHYTYTLSDGLTITQNPYYGVPNENKNIFQRQSVRNPTLGHGFITPLYVLITQNLVAGDTIDLTITGFDSDPTWLSARLHYMTGIRAPSIFDTSQFYLDDGVTPSGGPWVQWTRFLDSVVSPSTSVAGTSKQEWNHFALRYGIHDVNETLTWSPVPGSGAEQFSFDHGSAHIGYRWDQPQAIAIQREVISWASLGNHIMYYGQEVHAPGVGPDYSYVPRVDPSTIPGLHAVYHNGQWHVHPSMPI